ncbi:MAG: sensor histidine kinase, partial [Desulfobacteraceae bacterium]
MKLGYRIEFNVAAEKDFICFDITDNGGGVDENRIKQMFTLFYSSKGRKGTGLGMF